MRQNMGFLLKRPKNLHFLGPLRTIYNLKNLIMDSENNFTFLQSTFCEGCAAKKPLEHLKMRASVQNLCLVP